MLATIPTPRNTSDSNFQWTPHELTTSEPRRIVIVTQGASESVEPQLIRHVFQEAGRVPDVERSYSIELVSLDRRADRNDLYPLDAIDPSDAIDTIFITGSYEPAFCELERECLSWLKDHCMRSRRIVATAGGILYLAAMGLLNGRAAVSHWSMHSHIAGASSEVSVRSDILYTQDGNIYTCAGALASVDLVLSLVEEDLGNAVSSHVARHLLVPFQRTAICSQISSTLQAQISVKHPISDLLAWLPDQLASNLSVAKLARRVAMSPRNFARRFREQVKMTPAHYIEDLRFEAAKRELFREGESISEVAARCGFNNVESLRRLFQRRLGMTPKAFRDRMIGCPSSMQ
ncbi:GlxA family transcriptional regulator [Silvibacterium acidisoli]|uniref:GlxA family transcriptional regulator n=1 Tax=Acidobacteriaceae bacterium ZG23-2 TaxID=2883246 RepID=UPI00406D099D